MSKWDRIEDRLDFRNFLERFNIEDQVSFDRFLSLVQMPAKDTITLTELSIEEVRERFESSQTKNYGISKNWMVRFETGNYKDRDIQRDWMGWRDACKDLELIKE